MNLEDGRRPWGHYEILSDMNDHKVKRITVLPGSRLSLQSHKQRDEHWFVVRGSGLFTLDDGEIPVGAGRAVDIPRGARHRMQNVGKEDLVFIEVQTGDYFGEDDIVRYVDDYGRAGQ